MLLDLRETVRNSKPIKYTLITVICIPFVLFGIGSYFSAGGPGFAAKVDGTEISAQEFENAYSQQRRRLAQMFGGQIPEGFGDELALRQQALDGLVREQVVRNVVAENNFTVSDRTLAQTIQSIPEFQNAEGQFDKQRYLAQLTASHSSVDSFENSYRQNAAIGQFQSGIVQTSFSLPSEREQIESLTRQLRHVDTIRFPIEETRESIEVEDAEVQTYFDENADNFKFPERVKIKYIRLNTDLLAAAIEVTDEEAQEYFDANKGNYLTAEERKASHILLSMDEDADDSEVDEKTELLNNFRSRIEAGESFEDLAKEHSEDPGSATLGGSLGQIAPGVMVPAFESAVFSLQAEGDLSEPIRTQFGLHLIKLDEILPEKGETFEQAKSKVVTEITRSQAQNEFLDLQEILEQEAFDNPESLDVAAESTGLDVVETDWFDGGSETPFDLSNPAILSTALSEDVKDNGNNSEPLQLGQDDLMVLRTEQYEGPRLKSIDDVRDEVTDILENEKAGAILDESLEKARTLFDEGSALPDIAEKTGGSLSTDLALGRQSNDLDISVVGQVFELPKPAEGASVVREYTLDSGDRVLLAFRKVSVEEADAAASEAAGGHSGADNSSSNPVLGNAEFGALIQALQSKSEIETNDAVISGEAAYGGYGGNY